MLRVYNNTARYVDQGGNKVRCLLVQSVGGRGVGEFRRVCIKTHCLGNRAKNCCMLASVSIAAMTVRKGLSMDTDMPEATVQSLCADSF